MRLKTAPKVEGIWLAGDGAEAITPTDMVQPFSRNWSLNLIDDVVYTTTARGCGGILPRTRSASGG